MLFYSYAQLLEFFVHLFDTCFSSTLTAGSYTVAVTQFDNFASGPNLTDGFQRDGEGNFTGSFFESCSNGSFCDVSDVAPFNNRTSVWAYDVLNVTSAELPPEGNVPTPATLALFGLGLAGLGWSRRRKA